MNKNYDFGKCPCCGGDLHPIWFIEEEVKVNYGHLYYTGRKRKAVSHLTCEDCLNNECVDDSFDGEWY